MTRPPSLKIAYITAGAAGMFCGSCMHDNTLARALCRQPGVECLLIPTYTPIRTDEENVSVDRVFLGGVTVYLEEKFPLFRYVPAFLTRFLDQPWLIRWLAARAVGTDAADLGSLTISMLRGTDGHQRREVRQLCRWLAEHVRPDVVILTNMLIAGCVPALRAELNVPVLVTLQGDDIFLDSLPEPFRSRAFAEIRRLVPAVDGFLVNSRFYGEYMAGYFGLRSETIHRVPLGLDMTDFAAASPEPAPEAARPPTVGYLARLAPEKGLHLLVDAFLRLKRIPGMESTQLAIAGWLGAHRQAFADEQFARLRAAGLSESFTYAGSVDRAGKVRFLRGIDVLSVPTVYREPKGLFVLEALAAGVPVIEPDHGAFPELLAATGGGWLVPPNDPEALASSLARLLANVERRRQLGEQGRASVQQCFHADAMAKAVLEVVRQFVPGRLA